MSSKIHFKSPHPYTVQTEEQYGGLYYLLVALGDFKLWFERHPDGKIEASTMDETKPAYIGKQILVSKSGEDMVRNSVEITPEQEYELSVDDQKLKFTITVV